MKNVVTEKAKIKQYKATLKAAQAERQALLEEREQIDARIAGLDSTIGGLQILLGEDVTPSAITGLTDSIRTVLQKDVKYRFTPVGIKQHLELINFDLSRYKSPLSAIHTVLKRLLEADEVYMDDSDGRKMYGWKVKSDAANAAQHAATTSTVTAPLTMAALKNAAVSGKIEPK